MRVPQGFARLSPDLARHLTERLIFNILFTTVIDTSADATYATEYIPYARLVFGTGR